MENEDEIIEENVEEQPKVEIKKQFEILGEILESCKQPKTLAEILSDTGSYYAKLKVYFAYLEQHGLIESLENEKTYKTQIVATDKGIKALYYWRQFKEHIE